MGPAAAEAGMPGNALSSMQHPFVTRRRSYSKLPIYAGLAWRHGERLAEELQSHRSVTLRSAEGLACIILRSAMRDGWDARFFGRPQNDRARRDIAVLLQSGGNLLAIVSSAA